MHVIKFIMSRFSDEHINGPVREMIYDDNYNVWKCDNLSWLVPVDIYLKHIPVDLIHYIKSNINDNITNIGIYPRRSNHIGTIYPRCEVLLMFGKSFIEFEFTSKEYDEILKKKSRKITMNDMLNDNNYKRKFIKVLMRKFKVEHINMNLVKTKFTDFDYMYVGDGCRRFEYVIPVEIKILEYTDIFEYIRNAMDIYMKVDIDDIIVVVWRALQQTEYKVSLNFYNNAIDFHFTSKEFDELLFEVGVEQ